MDSLWPWLTLAAAGVLHGLNPATGWALGAGAAGGRGPLRLLVPIAAGHAAALAIVAAAVPATLMLGLAFDPRVLQALAGAGLLGLAAHHLRRHGPRDASAASGRACSLGLALWSFIVGTAQGAGWMLVPALAQVCVSGMPGSELTASGSLAVALAAVGVHLAAMLATMALLAAGARRGWELLRAAAAAAAPGRNRRPGSPRRLL